MAFSVGQRRAEFALRQALGASRGGVARLVLSRGLRIGLAGLLIGLVAALAGARALRSLLFGVAPTDPWTLLGVAVVLLGTLAVACLLPAWRASATAPRSVLD
jgi:ABC-type lipoprotein release transport system permease subunit